MSTAARAFAAARPELERLLGQREATGEAVRRQHGHDESGWPVMPPADDGASSWEALRKA